MDRSTANADSRFPVIPLESLLSRRDLIIRSLGFPVLMAGSGFLASCGGGGSAATTESGTLQGRRLTGKLAAQESSTQLTATQHAFDALDALGEIFGLETEKLTYEFDTEKELAQIDQMGTLGVTAVGTIIFDNSLMRPIAAAAVRNDLYISTRATLGQWIVPSEPEIDFHYQGLATPVEGAYAICVGMFEELGGSGKVVHLQGIQGVASDTAKTLGVDSALAEFPNIELVGRQRTDYTRDQGRIVLDEILTSVGEDVGAVYCQNDDIALGAIAALRERGLDNVLVSGADANAEAVDAIIAGDMYATEAIAIPWFAGYCTVQALDAANGHRPDPIEGLMEIDLPIIDTPESAQIYKGIIDQGSAAIPYEKMSRVRHPDDWDPLWPIRPFEPLSYWPEVQGVPKPEGYELPENYRERTEAGGHDEVTRLYEDHLQDFPFAEVVAKSRRQQTAFEVASDRNFSAIK